jgi:hypothetical protein
MESGDASGEEAFHLNIKIASVARRSSPNRFSNYNLLIKCVLDILRESRFVNS